jgi:hypothetical protein
MAATATTATTTSTTSTRRLRKGQQTARRRVWVQNVAVQAEVLEVRLAAIRARGTLREDQQQVAQGVSKLIDKARSAAFRDNPIPTRWGIWWRGTLIEAAYQNLHAAEALIASLFDLEELQAEIPEAVARVEATLNRDDPRRSRALSLLSSKSIGPDDVPLLRERLRKAIEVGYAVADQQHSRLRSFRNLVLSATVALTVFLTAFIAVVLRNPTWVPLCFAPASGKPSVCPTGAHLPSHYDIVIIALLGVLGGAFAAALSVSRLQGTSTPYNVPTALALLKVPFGVMTAVGSIIVIRGNFVPGLSNLDSQVQILAYAFVFGYAQQLLTKIIDRQGQTILNALPSKDSGNVRPELLTP